MSTIIALQLDSIRLVTELLMVFEKEKMSFQVFQLQSMSIPVIVVVTSGDKLRISSGYLSLNYLRMTRTVEKTQ